MGTRQGTLLERNIAKIFKLAGFEVKQPTMIRGYEVDVYAVKGVFDVCIQCKQYEKSHLNIRDLVHQWDSKNTREIKVSKVVIALFGVNISQKEHLHAKKYGITLWDEKNIADYLDLLIDNKNKGSEVLLKDLKEGTIIKAKLDKKDLFEGAIEDKEIPLTEYFRVAWGTQIVSDKVKRIMGDKQDYKFYNQLKLSDLDCCYICNKHPTSILFNIEVPEQGELPKATAIWLNSNKEIIEIIPNKKLKRTGVELTEGGEFTMFSNEFNSHYESRYCLVLKGKDIHNNMNIRDKLTFIEIK